MTSKLLSLEAHAPTTESLNLSSLRFKLTEENQLGTLEIRGRKHPVHVIEMSVCHFSAVMDFKSSKRIRLGGQACLRILDKDCQVVVRKMRLLDKGKVRLELEQIEESIPSEPTPDWFTHPTSARSSRGISLLPMALVIAAFTAALMLPSLGGRLGASKYISDAVQAAWRLAVEALKH